MAPRPVVVALVQALRLWTPKKSDGQGWLVVLAVLVAPQLGWYALSVRTITEIKWTPPRSHRLSVVAVCRDWQALPAPVLAPRSARAWNKPDDAFWASARVDYATSIATQRAGVRDGAGGSIYRNSTSIQSASNRSSAPPLPSNRSERPLWGRFAFTICCR